MGQLVTYDQSQFIIIKAKINKALGHDDLA